MVTFAAMRAPSEYTIRMVNKFRKREMSQVVYGFSQFIDKYYIVHDLAFKAYTLYTNRQLKMKKWKETGKSSPF